MLAFLGLIAGIAILIAGGTALVRGASEVAASLGVSPLVIGLTVVGFGTSAPELVVNIIGALRGATDIAFGNVVGSNISNLGLVLGAAALMSPLAIQGQVVLREVPLLLLATTMITVMALDGPLQGLPAFIGRSEAIVLLLLFCVFIYINAIDMVRIRRSDSLIRDIEDNPLIETHRKSPYRWLLVIAGMALLFAGGELTVRHGIALAASLGLSATVIGLFMVAVGTSMPELVTSIIAAARREPDLALGNIVGSNIFNSLIVLSASGVITQIAVPRGGIADLAVSWTLAALLIPIFIFGEARLGRRTGAMLLILYFGYVVARLVYEIA